MKISINDSEKLNAAIKEVERRSHVRTITAEKIRDVLDQVDDRLKLVSTKIDAIGTMVFCDPNAQHFPSAYHGIPESTHFVAELTRTGWKVVSIDRGICRSPTNRCRIQYTHKTLAKMQEKLSYIS